MGTHLTSVNVLQSSVSMSLYNCIVFYPVTAHDGIPEAEFPDYVKQMHQDGDKKFNLEFQVSGDLLLVVIGHTVR